MLRRPVPSYVWGFNSRASAVRCCSMAPLRQNSWQQKQWIHLARSIFGLRSVISMALAGHISRHFPQPTQISGRTRGRGQMAFCIKIPQRFPKRPSWPRNSKLLKSNRAGNLRTLPQGYRLRRHRCFFLKINILTLLRPGKNLVILRLQIRIRCVCIFLKRTHSDLLRLFKHCVKRRLAGLL